MNWRSPEKLFEDLFIGERLRLCPWSLALAFASSIPVLGLGRACPRKGCPWSRIFFVSLVLASNLLSSTPPLILGLIFTLMRRYCTDAVQHILVQGCPQYLGMGCIIHFLSFSGPHNSDCLYNFYPETCVRPRFCEGGCWSGLNQNLKYFCYLGGMLSKLMQLKRITKGWLEAVAG